MEVTEPFVVVLYGSHARGAADEQSDRDLLVVSDDSSVYSGIEAANPQACVSQYRWNEFRAMRNAGSPFLVHLKLEGRVIGGNDHGLRHYRTLLADLPAYAKSREDVRAFDMSLDDIESAIRERDSTPEFEAAAVATTIRHAAILGCYLLGQPRFERYAAIEHFCSQRNLPAEIAEQFPKIYAYRMSLARLRRWPDDANYELVKLWTQRARILVKEVDRLAV
ncbi:nucleotidyltransferase domain-containing protein [Micromonospora sp. IBSANI012]|uniref:nucleotidyltransferase domain-containing protein n=1 Tax=Micromonospora sp. IBSANI012 TaxID=3457761 RepID=UPI0040599897